MKAGNKFFILSINNNTYHQNPLFTNILDNIINLFIGEMIGKAILDQHMIPCYFTSSLYKMILKQQLNY